MDPDFVVDPDRGSSPVASIKHAEILSTQVHAERGRERAGARELDATVETMPGLSRQQRDRERAMPRDTVADLGHPRKERVLPAAGEVRGQLSSRQRKARSVTKRAVQNRLPSTQNAAVHRLITSERQWQQLNDALSEATGDAQVLEDAQRVAVQRIDRALQAYEKANDRGHIVYCNVRMPDAINESNLGGFMTNHFKRGTVLEFDRYTASSHCLHEIEPTAVNAQRTAVLEIQTRRGIYLGHSDSMDTTAHLLPRGMRLRVSGTHEATYRRPDGSTGRRQVIQLTDITTTTSTD